LHSKRITLETFIKVDPDFVDVSDEISVLADIVGIINEHTPDAIIKKPHTSSALIPSHEKENHSLLQSIATWLSYFGAISISTTSGPGVCLSFSPVRVCVNTSVYKRRITSHLFPSRPDRLRLV
jgi:hypothetical protein